MSLRAIEIRSGRDLPGRRGRRLPEAVLAPVLLAAALGAASAAHGDDPPAAAPAPQPAPAATAVDQAPGDVLRQGPIADSPWKPLSADGRARAADSPLQFKLPSPIDALEKQIGYPIDGALTNRYRLRYTAHDSDQDLIQLLSLRAGDPSKNKVSGAFLGRLSEDIDGRAPRGQFSTFSEVTDTYRDNVNGRFYLGYLDLRRFAWLDATGIELVRGGRQTFDESAETFVFDGGRIDSKPIEALRNLRLSAYGGLPVHYFESNPSGDALAGVGAEVETFRRGRARLDWTYVEDRRGTFREKDNLLSFGLWQGIGERVTLHGRYNLLDGNSRDWTARGTYVDPRWDLLLQASFHQVLRSLRDFSTELDPYASVLQVYRPFWEVDLRASKGLGEHFVVDAGVLVRELREEGDEGTFNHDFRRYWISPATREWPVPGMSISVTGEIWDAEGDHIYTAGADVSQRFAKVLTASFGSFYSLYRFDALSGTERTHDRTFYGKLEWQVLKDLKLMGLYQLERDDIATYQTVEIDLRYSF